MKFIAYSVKGLEKISVQEIKSACPDVKEALIEDKVILFETNADLKILSELRTIDDIGIFVGEFFDVENLSFDEITSQILSFNFSEFKSKISSFRELDNTFSLTLSIAGVDIDSENLLTNISEELTKKYNWEYTYDSHNNFDIRIFLNKKKGYVSIRLTSQSLLHRPHKLLSAMGALRSTVAGAMVFLATKDKGANLKVVDNFCGSGTILEEAFIKGHQVFGGDIEEENVEKTHTNLENLEFTEFKNIKQQDAVKTVMPSNTFDCAISNLPWDKQVPVASITDTYAKTLREYKRILKQDCKICLIVSKPEILVKLAKQTFINHRVETFRISYLGQQPTIVFIY